jgi:hypothetical protein
MKVSTEYAENAVHMTREEKPLLRDDDDDDDDDDIYGDTDAPTQVTPDWQGSRLIGTSLLIASMILLAPDEWFPGSSQPVSAPLRRSSTAEREILAARLARSSPAASMEASAMAPVSPSPQLRPGAAGRLTSSSSALAAARRRNRPDPDSRVSTQSREVDFVFGVVAFDSDHGCQGKCVRADFDQGVRQWVSSVRRHTDLAHTEVAIFTGERRGNVVTGNTALADELRKAHVHVIEGDFGDAPSRVAHRERSKYVHCVMRNRWFVIRDHLRRHHSRYRHVLMADVRDAILQANPFGWTPQSVPSERTRPGAQGASPWAATHAGTGAGTGGFDLSQSIVMSGEGSGKVRTLKASRKGLPRTIQCAANVSEETKSYLLTTDPLNAVRAQATRTNSSSHARAQPLVSPRPLLTPCRPVRDRALLRG